MSTVIIPIPRLPLSVRDATMADVPFIDALQKRHAKSVGFMPGRQIEGKIGAGQVLVAWATSPCSSDECQDTGRLPVPREERVGYVIGQDRYFKHDDVGIVYQLNVAPGRQRSFVGATLLKAMFDRAAYGCKLFCCWCAQDIEANRFWEAMGFVPLAFRAGSEKKSRVHIFWQKRIRAGDTTTPWWFPAQTTGGAIREDRLVLPIPPGTHWSETKPIILPGAEQAKQLPAPKKQAISRAGVLRFAPPKPVVVEPVKTKKPREKKPKPKNDPKLVAAARELRDRWLEHVNANEASPALIADGKYDLTRAALPARISPAPALLPAA